MKKAYINPEMEIIRMETAQMIATSLGIGESIDSASGAESREFDDIKDLLDLLD